MNVQFTIDVQDLEDDTDIAAFQAGLVEELTNAYPYITIDVQDGELY